MTPRYLVARVSRGKAGSCCSQQRLLLIVCLVVVLAFFLYQHLLTGQTWMSHKRNHGGGFWRAGANDLLPYAGNRSVILLLTYPRSGSSFTGDLLVSGPDSFFIYNPMHYMMGEVYKRKPSWRSNLLKGVKQLTECDFLHLDPAYFHMLKSPSISYFLPFNHLLMRSCQGKRSKCLSPRLHRRVCLSARTIVIKEFASRIPLIKLRQLIKSFSPAVREHLKVILLIRDPRGTYASRKQQPWCMKRKSCGHPDIYCQEMEMDLVTLRQLKHWQPDMFFLVRFEDLALFPQGNTVRLFDQLGLPFTPSVQSFLDTHTRAPGNSSLLSDPYSTVRDSRSRAVDWVRNLSSHEIRSLEQNCSPVLRQMRLLLVPEQELRQEPHRRSLDPWTYVGQVPLHTDPFATAFCD